MTCSRQFGCNWQRKMWINNDLYWRARYDPDTFDPSAVNPSTGDGSIVIEYISEEDLNNPSTAEWTENTSARIYMTDYEDGLVYMADFSVRGEENGIPTTIIFASGSKVYVAESDQSNNTTWNWENVTAVFDNASSSFTHVNLGANRDTQPILWAIAAESVGVDNKVIVRNQDTSLDLTDWNSSTTISVETTDDILGSTVRSMAEAGVGKKDMIFVWKEEGTIYSRYFDSPTLDTIETVCTDCSIIRSHVDVEHYIDASDKKVAVAYILNDNSVQFRTRDIGSTAVWSDATEILAADTNGCPCLAVHPEDIHVICAGQDSDIIKYRTYNIRAEVWSNEQTFSSNTDAIDGTTTASQLQTTSSLLDTHHLVLNWIGGDDCDIGFGILDEVTAQDCSPTQSSLIDAILAKLKTLTDYEVFYKMGKQNEALPYITFDLISDVLDWQCFDGDFYKVGLQVNVWSKGTSGIRIATDINDDIHAGLNRHNLTIYCDDFLIYNNKYIFSTTSRGQCEIDKEYIHVWSEYEINSLDS